jgi:hypothetical protein
MQNPDLFLSLAEIAGVFVGFGALIAVRNSATLDVAEVNGIRWVVTTGIWAVIVALAPIVVSEYGIVAHELWLACSVLALALLAIMIVVYSRTPENRAEVAGARSATPVATIALVMGTTFWLEFVLLVVALVLVVFGAFPDREQAIYLSAVALGLLMSALGLFVAVFWPTSRRSAQAADRDVPYATRDPASQGGDAK